MVDIIKNITGTLGNIGQTVQKQVVQPVVGTVSSLIPTPAPTTTIQAQEPLTPLPITTPTTPQQTFEEQARIKSRYEDISVLGIVSIPGTGQLNLMLSNVMPDFGEMTEFERAKFESRYGKMRTGLEIKGVPLIGDISSEEIRGYGIESGHYLKDRPLQLLETVAEMFTATKLIGAAAKAPGVIGWAGKGLESKKAATVILGSYVGLETYGFVTAGTPGIFGLGWSPEEKQAFTQLTPSEISAQRSLARQQFMGSSTAEALAMFGGAYTGGISEFGRPRAKIKPSTTQPPIKPSELRTKVPGWKAEDISVDIKPKTKDTRGIFKTAKDTYISILDRVLPTAKAEPFVDLTTPTTKTTSLFEGAQIVQPTPKTEAARLRKIAETKVEYRSPIETQYSGIRGKIIESSISGAAEPKPSWGYKPGELTTYEKGLLRNTAPVVEIIRPKGGMTEADILESQLRFTRAQTPPKPSGRFTDIRDVMGTRTKFETELDKSLSGGGERERIKPEKERVEKTKEKSAESELDKELSGEKSREKQKSEKEKEREREKEKERIREREKERERERTKVTERNIKRGKGKVRVVFPPLGIPPLGFGGGGGGGGEGFEAGYGYGYGLIVNPVKDATEALYLGKRTPSKPQIKKSQVSVKSLVGLYTPKQTSKPIRRKVSQTTPNFLSTTAISNPIKSKHKSTSKSKRNKKPSWL